MPKQNGEARALLTEAAAALEAELDRFEQLASAARKIPLDSEKNLARAAKAMQESADSQEKTAALVRALVEAVNVARAKQQETAEALLARAEELKARSDTLGDLLGRFRTLGEDARAVQSIVQQAGEKGAGNDIQAAIDTLDRARSGIESIVERASELAQDARTHGLVDVEREADSLRQQLVAAKNKLGLAREGLVKRA